MNLDVVIAGGIATAQLATAVYQDAEKRRCDLKCCPGFAIFVTRGRVLVASAAACRAFFSTAWR